MRVVILGNGIAGNQVAFSLRGKDEKIDITIVSNEGGAEYDPCSLPYFVGGEIAREAVFRKKMSQYRDHRIGLILNRGAESIDAGARIVRTAGGDDLHYDKLVLCHGVDSFAPAIDGLDKEGIFFCKTLADADRLRGHPGKSCVVVGSGSIGSEVAEAMKKRGYEVHLIEIMERILPTLFDEPASKILADTLDRNGVRILTGERVTRVEGGRDVTAVQTDKRSIACDTVVFAAGVKPDNRLAQSAGIRVSRGILVDEWLATSVEHIYACGDCVEGFDITGGERCMIPLKHNAIEQARIVADNILGREVKYPGAYIFTRTHFFNTHAATLGKTALSVAGEDDVECVDREEEGDYLRVVLKSGKIVGAQAVGGSGEGIGLLLGAMWRGEGIQTIKDNRGKIYHHGFSYPWMYRKLGYLIGLDPPDDGEKSAGSS